MQANVERKQGLRPERLGSTIYEMLQQRLMSLDIKPGDRISVDNLVRELGVSQTPIREALSRLEAQGLVVKTHLIGYSAAPRMSAEEFRDLYELRLLLEPCIAAKAATNISREDMAALLALHDEIIEIVRNGTDRAAFNRVSALDAEVHARIALASGNRLFHETIVRQRQHAHLYRLGYHSPWLAGVVSEHQQIVDAIARGDADAASKSMRHHIEQSFQRYVDAS